MKDRARDRDGVKVTEGQRDRGTAGTGESQNERAEKKCAHHLWSVLSEHAYELVWIGLAALVQ